MSESFPIPAGYRILKGEDLAAIVAARPELGGRLGGAPEAWRVTEVSDGNMNAVWRLKGPEGSLILKQAVPYIRVIGEGWPFPVSRIEFEAKALALQEKNTPGLAPALLHHDPALGLLVLEDLDRHVVVRIGFVEGRTFPRLPADMGDFLARSLFHTSDFFLPSREKKALAAAFAGNAHLSETTEEVIFTGPYGERPFNLVTPGNEEIAARFRSDDALKRAASEMKLVYRTKSEALLHGDLHTGSIMANAEETRVIDAEWAFHGPMGFDVGALMGNLYLAAISQPGHATERDDRREQAGWLLGAAGEVWDRFGQRFRELVRTEGGEFLAGDVPGRKSAEVLVEIHLTGVFHDALGFAGAKMIRRILGISHVQDFEMIADVETRARLERHALRTGRRLLLERRNLVNPAAVAALLDETRAE